MAEPDAASDIDGAMSSPARQAFADRLVEDGEAFVELGLGDGQWRRDAPDARRAPVAADVHAEAQLEAALGDARAELVVGLARLAVADDLDAPHQAGAAQIADRLVALHQVAQAGAQALAQLGGALDQPLARDDLEHGAPGRRRQRVLRSR